MEMRARHAEKFVCGVCGWVVDEVVVGRGRDKKKKRRENRLGGINKKDHQSVPKLRRSCFGCNARDVSIIHSFP